MQENFTEDQWFVISSAPSLVGSAMAVAGRSGVMGTMKEIMTSGQTLAAGGEKYPSNPLIQAIVPDRNMDRGEAKESMVAKRDKLMAQLKEQGIQSPEDMAEFAITSLSHALSLISPVASDQDVAEYKEWVVETGQAVAEAAKEGGFLGMGGTQVSEAESAFLGRIRKVSA